MQNVSKHLGPRAAATNAPTRLRTILYMKPSDSAVIRTVPAVPAPAVCPAVYSVASPATAATGDPSPGTQARDVAPARLASGA